MDWFVILGAFVGALVGSALAVMISLYQIGKSSSEPIQIVPPEILDRIRTAKMKYGLDEVEEDVDFPDLNLDPEYHGED